MTTVRDKLVGSWRMIDWVLLEGDKKLAPPLGPADQCGGLLIYSADGMMSAMLSAKDRENFTDGSIDGGTDAEKVKAYESIVCYAGSYSVDEISERVTHQVEYATLPNFVGQRLERICIFEGDDVLKLDTPEMKFGGVPRASYILWQRVG